MVVPATGTVIGLAVSKRLAQTMGGAITVKSHPGQGSCFTLTIVAPEVAQVQAHTEDEEEMPLPALNVLLVEVIELNVLVARSVLEKLGSSVEVAMTGKDELAMFDPNEFDLVLLEMQLPDMTGLEIASQLKRRYQRRQMPPLIALTSNVRRISGSIWWPAWTTC